MGVVTGGILIRHGQDRPLHRVDAEDRQLPAVLRRRALEWSPEAAEIHGYEPASMTLTTGEVMSYKHPDDRAKILANMDHLRRTHEVLSSRYRMIDARGQTRELVSSARNCSTTTAP